MTTFSGFPPQALQFFIDIKRNNNRDWFQAHKSEYISYVQEPAVEFVIALGSQLQELAPEVQFNTATNGSGSVMRIYRDVRFSKDKSPYKDWLGIRFWEGASRKNLSSGVFFGISDDGGGIHVGQHMFSKEFLSAYRRAVDDDSLGAELAGVVDALGQDYVLQGERYKKVPRGFPQDHPRADLLKFKALYASAEDLAPETITSPHLVDICMDHFEKMAPLHHWLVKVGKEMAG